jgi:hypothetical protein
MPKRPTTDLIRNPTLFGMDKIDPADQAVNSPNVEHRYSDPGLLDSTHFGTRERENHPGIKAVQFKTKDQAGKARLKLPEREARRGDPRPGFRHEPGARARVLSTGRADLLFLSRRAGPRHIRQRQPPFPPN